MNRLFSTPLTQEEQAILDALEHYVLFGQKRSLKRTPHRLELAKPLPTGRPFATADDFSPGSIAIMAHIFYEDACGVLANCFANMPFPYKLLVSTDTKAKKTVIETAFRSLPNLAGLDVRITVNRGRDIAPLVVEFARDCLEHDFVLHVHSKRSRYGEETQGWFEHCLDHLLHSPLYVDSIFRRFAADHRLGVFYPPPFPGIARYMHWAATKPTALKALARMRLPASLIDAFPLDFPAGSMMLFRTAALEPLFKAGFAIEDFPAEDGQTNDTLAHAIERLIFHVAHHQGFGREKGRPAAPGEYFRPRLLSAPARPAAMPVADEPEVSIVVPALDQWAYTSACLASIGAHTDPQQTPYEVIIADDGSTDETLKAEKLFPGVRRIRTERNLGFVGNCNFAAAQARGKYVAFLNNDTQVQPGWLHHLVDIFRTRRDAAIAGSKLVYPDGGLQEAGGIVWRSAGAMNYGRNKDPALAPFCYVKECDYVSGACLLVRADFFRACGGFDARFEPAYYEDTDLAFQARKAGLKAYYQPASIVVHFEGGSHGTDLKSGIKRNQDVNRGKFQKKWATVLARDQVTNKQMGRARERSMGKKIIAVFDYVLPEYDRHAGARYTLSYMKLLLERGYLLKFFACKVEDERQLTFARQLEQMGVETHHPSIIGVEQNWISWIADHSANIDAFWINRPHVANRHMAACRKSGKPIIYFCHDLQSMRHLREAKLMGDRKRELSARQQEKHEIDILRGASVVYTPSVLERDYLRRKHGLPDVIAHPLYLFERPRLDRLTAPSGQDIVFVGSLRHRPNRDGIVWFLRDVWPGVASHCPNARLHIVGDGNPEQVIQHGGPHVLIHGGIDDRTLGLIYAGARAAILPLRFGAGVKGKLVEAFMHRLPVVSTSVGLEGVSGIGAHVAATDTPSDFAAALARILDCDDNAWIASANALARFGYAKFSKKRGWHSLHEGLARIGLLLPAQSRPCDNDVATGLGAQPLAGTG